MESSTVIIGAGIIGCSTAYYLSDFQVSGPTHLVESSPELFASASGKAGGFLAADWFGSSSASLGQLSFDLHKDLADSHDGRNRWGYSPSTGTSLAKSSGGTKGARGDDWLRQGTSRAEVAAEHEFVAGDGPAWLTRKKGDSIEIISEINTVAQLDPLRLSQYLLSESRKRGIHLHQPATAVSIITDETNTITGIRIRDSITCQESELPCTRLLITAGAWTPRVFSALFPASQLTIPITSLAGHSLILRSPRWSSTNSKNSKTPQSSKAAVSGCHAIFTTSTSGFSPEIFSRLGDSSSSSSSGAEEIYMAGLNSSSIPLPDLATDAKIRDTEIRKLMRVGEELLGLPKNGELHDERLSDLEVLRTGLCFRPVTNKGTPILARVRDAELGGGIRTRTLTRNEDRNGDGAGHDGHDRGHDRSDDGVSRDKEAAGGVYIAAGHGPWGISLSLGTGKCMAEMMTEGQATSADVSGLGL